MVSGITWLNSPLRTTAHAASVPATITPATQLAAILPEPNKATCPISEWIRNLCTECVTSDNKMLRLRTTMACRREHNDCRAV